MKILVFTSLYPNNVWAHHGVFVKERMTRVAHLQGCNLKVVAPVPYFPPIKHTRRSLFSEVAPFHMIEGVEVYHPRYYMVPKVGMTFHGLMMFYSVLHVVKRLKTKFDFDVIDSHYVYPDGFAAIQLGRIFRKPVVVSARGSDINLFAKFSVIRMLLQYTLTKADAVIAVCEALKNAMIPLDIPMSKVTVIPNGVDTTKFFPLPKPEAKYLLGLPAAPVILSVGNLVERKGFDIIIKAVRILIDDFNQKNLFLVIVGDGEMRPRLERLVASLDLTGNVLMAGDKPHKELYQWYSAADLFCLASSREGWPNVILEALACGTPVVATNVWGVPEIINSEQIGLLTNRNEQDIARTLYAGLTTTWRPDSLVDFAKCRTWDNAALAVLEVLDGARTRFSGFDHRATVNSSTSRPNSVA